MKLYPFSALLARMKYITRWSLMHSTRPESLSEHTCDTALMAHILCLIARRYTGTPCRPKTVAVAALYHDAPEIITGDMPTPVKYSSPGLRDAYKALEAESVASMTRLLPPELATLGITELEFEFYRKLVEKQLLTYRLHGDAWREKITERPVTRQEFDEQPRGPFIVCVDTSGSMGGFNEQCAKAFCLALMRIALADNRRCFIMLFSSEVVHYELTSESGLEQAIRFLSQRFRGGTDLASCFRAIIERLQNPQWVDADAVVISDFIAQRLPDEVIAQVGELQRKHQHRFHAVAMSVHGKPGIMRIFDHIWRFDTGLRSRLLRRWRR